MKILSIIILRALFLDNQSANFLGEKDIFNWFAISGNNNGENHIITPSEQIIVIATRIIQNSTFLKSNKNTMHIDVITVSNAILIEGTFSLRDSLLII